MTLCSEADECQKALGPKYLEVLLPCEFSGEQILEILSRFGSAQLKDRWRDGHREFFFAHTSCTFCPHPSVNLSGRASNAVSNKSRSIL